MIEQAKKLFVVEYSITVDATRVKSVGAMLENNLHSLAKNSASDYMPVALFETRSQAEICAIEFQRRLESQVVSGSHNWKHISEVIEGLVPQLLSNRGPRQK